MRIIAAAGLAGACLATSPLYAADLFGSAPPPMAPVESQELGSNWYIRGDLGYGTVDQATVVPSAGLIQPNHFTGRYDAAGVNWTQLFKSDGSPGTFNDAPIGSPAYPVQLQRGNNQKVDSAVVALGVGYRVNDWLRIEGTYSFVNGPGYSLTASRVCPQVANAVTQTTAGVDAAGNATTVTTNPGYMWSPNPCTANLGVKQYNNLALASAYADLGHWWMGITPYIGAGIGLNVNTITGSLTYTQDNDGQTYNGPQVNGSALAAWVVPAGKDSAGNVQYARVQDRNHLYPGVAFGPQNWNRTINSTRYTIAGQLAAGFGMPISQSAMLDVGYKLTTADVFGGVKGLFQSVNLGVRYNIN